MPKLTKYEDIIPDSARTLTIYGNEGIVSFCESNVFLIRPQESKEGFTVKTAPISTVDLGHIKESSPPEDRFNKVDGAENENDETVTQVTFHLENKTIQEIVNEDPEKVGRIWLEYVVENGHSSD